MKTRQLGKTGIEVSELGFGAWQLGNTEDWGEAMAEETGIALVHQAIELGVNFFDTAPPYGRGNSERVLGNALRGKRDKVVLCSKFGYTHDYESDFTATGLRQSLDHSLQSLQTDYLDVLLVHSPAESFYKEGLAVFDELEQLKKNGVIRAYGISADYNHELNTVLDNTQSEVCEVLYNVLFQQATDALDKAYQQGVGVIAKVPLDSGWLSGAYGKSKTFDGTRARWSKDQIQQRHQLVEALKQRHPEQAMLPLALQFSLSHPAISTTIPGVKNAKQLESNVQAISQTLPAQTVTSLRDFWLNDVRALELEW